MLSSLRLLVKRFDRLIRYGIVGVSATLINLVFFSIFLRFLAEPLAYVIALEMALIADYFGHRYFTFSDRSVSLLRGILKFHLVSVGTIAVHSGTYSLFRFFVFEAQIGQQVAASLIATFVAFVFNFILHNYFTFRYEKKP